jgi:uncharacterized repeat protein (TIGR03837 family)
VVDNYGDAGVAWRLARSVAREHGKRVRLWLDDVATLARLRPEVDAQALAQVLEGVEIRRWQAGTPDPGRDGVAEVVVETFGCETPEAYVEAMAARTPRPRWVNLEYLSAEAWVEGCHALPSPHPRHAPLTRHFFFPGFTPQTGGLLRESGLLARRDSFRRDAATQERFWSETAGRIPPPASLRISLFGYDAAPFAALLGSLATATQPIWLAVPEGAASRAAQAWAHARGAAEGGALSVVPLPFLHQDRYDELLWACGVNFVRGEDSFVRAQWAGVPFVWQPYPTADGAHQVKLTAFLARYTAGMDRATAAAVTGLWEAWNRGEGVGPGWQAFEAALPALRPLASEWSARLASRPGLAAQLVDFADHLIA